MEKATIQKGEWGVAKRAEERLHKIMYDLMFLAGRRMTAGPEMHVCVHNLEECEVVLLNCN